ncbi:zinc finger FYVE domain-containing protein 9 [Calliphora vicina]|uniref:zinc finger FYVE domain-containing protein 9 n=1 Tax=Calliphora vicina TaxID=7373 RepID=UPI00325B4D86
MDLVDIDQVLDNLELHEEAENEQRRAEEKLSKSTQPQPKSSTNTNNGYVQQSLEEPTGKSGFKAVSQVFNSLDDYCNNVESLESKASTTTVSEICQKSHEDYDNGHRFQPQHTVSSSKQELAEYENEVEESKDIHKFTEEKRNKLKTNNDSVERDTTDSNNSFTSESLTTSSNSTFSSGPSFEVESSLEDPIPATQSKEEKVINENIEGSQLRQVEDTATIPINKLSPETKSCHQSESEQDLDKEHLLETEDEHQPNIVDDNKSQNIEDLAQGLSSISITSVNFQSQSILPLETSISSSSLGKVLDNLTVSEDTSALSQIRDISDKAVTSETKLTSIVSEPPNTSVEVINESVQQQHSHQMQQPQQPPQQNAASLPQPLEYVACKMEAQVQIQQPITFCSTMDDISDTELDSMLQEMDIDEEGADEQQKPKPEFVAIVNSVDSEILENPKDQIKETYAATIMEQKEEIASLSSSGDHPNGDSFSQASTVEFSEIRPQLENENDVAEPENNMVINSPVSSYSNSESSSLEGDIIRPKNIEVEDDGDASRPQRPTSLDLPAIQALDLYANAGQTPPGNEQSQQQPQLEQEQAELQTPSPEVEPHENPITSDVAEATGYSEDPNANLGKVPPIWVPDNMATGCMQCSAKFTMIKRRHHCRACGKVLCSVCCSQKFKLEFLTEPESRVCVQCYLILTQRQTQSVINSRINDQIPSALTQDTTAPMNDNVVPTDRSPNPNNPMEYCSTIPPYRQVSTEPKTTPSVIVPVGVLKKDNGSYSSNSSNSSGQKARKRKSVMFSDGIAPGSDLASIDQWNEPKQPRRQSDRSNRNSNGSNKPSTPTRSEHITDVTTMGLVAQLFRGSIPPSAAAATLNTVQSNSSSKSSKGTVSKQITDSSINNKASSAVSKSQDNSRAKRLPPSGCDDHGCFIPAADGALPPIVTAKDESGCDYDYKDVTNNYDLVKRLQNETLKFAVQKNFFVFAKIVNLKCCLNRTVINFTTYGMHHVGNDEIVILLEFEPPASKEDVSVGGNLIPKDIFVHLNEIYNNAESGNPIQDLTHTSPQQPTFLGSRDYGGFIFIRPTFQCMQDIILPDNPYLIGILIHRYEVPWAKVFPLRLMLRLGAQYRYYPCPHVSMVNRDSVYAEIAQTIINFLADFRNYTYTLPFIRGMYIHMEDRQTTVVIPRNRLEDVIKAINNSSDHILAFGGNFSKSADGHLVCMQNVNDDRTEMYAYSTQAINIQGQPRKVTGASFFVLNESLKTTSGLSGKCSIVEDGLMVQILPSKMEEVRNSLKNQTDVTIICGPIDADEQHTEIVCLKWVENDKEFNIGVKSPIDDRLMDGISSMRVHASFNYSNSNYAIRLTDIYVVKYDNWYNTNSSTISAATTSDITRMTEQIARSTSMALVPFLDLLAASKSTKIGLRATLHQDNVCYEAGTRGEKLPPLYMNAMDNHLIPTLHSISSSIEEAIILELIFYILNV